YFSWDIDRTFWEVLSVDHGRLLRNAVDWAANEPRPVTVTGPGVLDVTLWRQKDSMTVHLVNLTNPMMMKGPLRQFLPLPAQQVGVRLPDGRKPRGVKLLVGGGTPRRVRRDGTAHCMEGALFGAAALRMLGHPPLILDFEAVRDDDHVIAIFRIEGHWGSVAKSNYSGLRYREPVYRTLRELAMS